jgi:hypothetical protein
MAKDAGWRQHLVGLPKRNHSSAAVRAKATLRRNVMNAVGADQAHVFDAFAGDGGMYRAVWHDAASYVGCDLVFHRDDRPAFVGDNRRVLRCLELADFNVFDLDAYGCPWEQAYIIAKRRKLRPGETIGLTITEGQAMKLKFGGMSNALGLVADVDFRRMAGMAKGQDWLMARAINNIADMMGARVTRRWEAVGNVGSRMFYIGLVLRGS